MPLVTASCSADVRVISMLINTAITAPFWLITAGDRPSAYPDQRSAPGESRDHLSTQSTGADESLARDYSSSCCFESCLLMNLCKRILLPVHASARRLVAPVCIRSETRPCSPTIFTGLSQGKTPSIYPASLPRNWSTSNRLLFDKRSAGERDADAKPLARHPKPPA